MKRKSHNPKIKYQMDKKFHRIKLLKDFNKLQLLLMNPTIVQKTTNCLYFFFKKSIN